MINVEYIPIKPEHELYAARINFITIMNGNDDGDYPRIPYGYICDFTDKPHFNEMLVISSDPYNKAVKTFKDLDSAMRYVDALIVTCSLLHHNCISTDKCDFCPFYKAIEIYRY